MSDATGKKPDASTAEPVAADPILDEPAASVPSTSVPVATGDAEGQAAAEVDPATPGSSPMAGAQVVYVTAPIPPQPKGNRVVGAPRSRRHRSRNSRNRSARAHTRRIVAR